MVPNHQADYIGMIELRMIIVQFYHHSNLIPMDLQEFMKGWI
jgi:hypothetical protein